MDSLMPELIALIYSHILMPADWVRFSLTQVRIYNCIPSEIIRILKIYNNYRGVFNRIKSIEYCQHLDCISISKRDNNNTIIWYGNCSISKSLLSTSAQPLNRYNAITFMISSHKSSLSMIELHGSNVMRTSSTPIISTIDEFIANALMFHQNATNYRVSDVCERIRAYRP